MPPERRFAGFDGYKAAIASCVGVVLLCSAPHFRPMHLAETVAAGKHVFCEKPMFVDAPGYRSVVESVKAARGRKLNLVSGFCWRRSTPERATFAEIEKGTLDCALNVASGLKSRRKSHESGGSVGDSEAAVRRRMLGLTDELGTPGRSSAGAAEEERMLDVAEQCFMRIADLLHSKRETVK